jgi:preprotein translocase subunit SecF
MSNAGVSAQPAKQEQDGSPSEVLFPQDPEGRLVTIHGRKSSVAHGGAAMRDMILLILISVLFGNSVLEARGGAPATGASLPEETTKKATMQERIMEIPPGTIVEVRLMNKHTFRGRLGEVTNEGFSLQTAQGNKVETQKIAFTEVKTLKKIDGETTGKKFSRGIIYGLAGIGVLMVILVIWAVSHSD